MTSKGYEEAMNERLDAGPPGPKDTRPITLVTIKLSVFSKILKWFKERLR